jgi:hypothetical protein
LRIFLDSNALSDLLKDDVPLPADVLAERCREADVELILAFSNIARLLRSDDAETIIESGANALQGFSLAYIRHALIPESELRAAVGAFSFGVEPGRIDPYAEAFYGDYEAGSDTFENVILKIDAERTLRFAGLRQKLLHVLADKRGFGFSSEEEDRLRERIREDADGARWDKQHFRRVLERWLPLAQLKFGAGASAALFENWLYERPGRAPGWRFFVESFQSLLAEDEDAPNGTDIYDFTNLTMAPYADAMVLPERVINFAAKAQRRLVKRQPDFDLLSRIHVDAASALRALNVRLTE